MDTGRGGGRIPGHNLPMIRELFRKVTGSARGSRGVSVEVSDTQAAADLTATVPYGRPIPDVTKEIRNNVIRRVERLTGLEVIEVNITVKDIFFSEQQ